MDRDDWPRRRVLARAGTAAAGLAGLGGLGLAGCTAAAPAASGGRSAASPARSGGGHSTQSAGEQRFVSRPDLTPPMVTATGRATGGGRYIFLAPSPNGPGQGGAMILDQTGGLVWFSPAAGRTRLMDVRVQTYRGRPALTWWEGEISHVGVGEGVAVIADTSYRPVHTIHARRGLRADLHEFLLTPQGTALITAYRPVQADLSRLGGPASGTVLSGVAQEIDVATGRLLFEWSSIDHVDVTETWQKFTGGTAGKPFDYFHINSIDVAPDGDLIVSARNTWAVYKIARPGGQVRWRLGGKRTSFAMGPGTRFYWQHDARAHGPGMLSLFDDAAAPPKERQSRALLIDLDVRGRRATLRRQYTHPDHPLADAEGNVQLLADGNVFVGWGTTARFSEFSQAGALLFDGALPKNDETYRAFVHDWSGRPAQRPAAAARVHGGGTTVYASWNGATEVASWAVSAGGSPASLAPAGSARRSGFETAITVGSTGPYFLAEARDGRGRPLGRSAAVRARRA